MHKSRFEPRKNTVFDGLELDETESSTLTCGEVDHDFGRLDGAEIIEKFFQIIIGVIGGNVIDEKIGGNVL
jgi:hypothetical protein